MDTADTITINGLGAAFFLLMAALMLGLPRRQAVLPLLLTSAFMTYGQTVVVLGLNFYLLRLMILVGWLRVVVRSEVQALRWNRIDRLVLIWMSVVIVTYCLRQPSLDALVNRLGHAYNALGLYFLFRVLVRDLEDMKIVLKLMVLVAIPVAVAMGIEKTTARNAFAVFGGVPEITEMRVGVLRSQGAFRHPILAGVFGATQLPLFVALWRAERRRRIRYSLAILSVAVIAVASGSSGPVLVFAAGVGALAMWPLRRHLRTLRWGSVALLLLLALAMKAPVWFLLARINVFSKSTGWHRAHLIDVAMDHLDEWWLLGSSEYPSWGFLMWDVTNQYLAWGLQGGLVSMLLFIVIIGFSFQGIGRLRNRLERESPSDAFLAWGAGCALFAHVIAFFSVSYFDQNITNWYLLLAMMSSVAMAPRLEASSSSREVSARNRHALGRDFGRRGYIRG